MHPKCSNDLHVHSLMHATMALGILVDGSGLYHMLMHAHTHTHTHTRTQKMWTRSIKQYSLATVATTLTVC